MILFIIGQIGVFYVCKSGKEKKCLFKNLNSELWGGGVDILR